MLAIIPGVILFFLNDVVVAAVSPVLLYYYQLLGIILIWLGIVGFLGVKEYPQLDQLYWLSFQLQISLELMFLLA